MGWCILYVITSNNFANCEHLDDPSHQSLLIQQNIVNNQSKYAGILLTVAMLCLLFIMVKLYFYTTVIILKVILKKDIKPDCLFVVVCIVGKLILWLGTLGPSVKPLY